MIKSLSKITDISVIDQNGKNDILSFSRIEFDEKELGSGGFGSVHNVQSIDGISKSEFVIKIFTDEDNKQHAYDVIQLLHDKLKKRQRKTDIPIYHDLPELLGMPFLVFKGYDTIAEKECVAFLMYNIEKLNYEDYGSDTGQLKEYKNLAIPDKLYLAYQLAKTIDVLHQMEFIHADLSENSLWFNSNRVQLAIIDYDSGYHFDLQNKPTTIGKVGHWIGSRFRNMLGQQKNSSNLNTLDRLYEEYWVLANAVFEIVFGVMPFFYLSDTDDTTKKSYLKKFEWPNIDTSSPLFNNSNTEQHKAILSFIEQFENSGAKELIDAFKLIFNKGYSNETKRLTSKEWKDLLFNLNQAVENYPNIIDFNSDKTEIKEMNEVVIFNVNTKKYNSIFVNGNLLHLHQDTISIPLQNDCEVVLKVTNDFNTIEKIISIKAIKVSPEITSFKASSLIRKTLTPIELTWLVKNAKSVSLSGQRNQFLIESSFNVEPKEKTTYILTANGFFNEKVSTEITIDTIKPTIEYFTWEVNLNHGIANVDISWNVKDAETVTITPHSKSSSTKGSEHISISERTEFSIVAHGIFTDVTKELVAHPFPVPIVKQIFADAPKIEINTNIDFSESKLPKELFDINKIQFNNSVTFNDLEINSTELKNALDFPEFENENALINLVTKKKITITDIYDRIVEKIHKKLN